MSNKQAVLEAVQQLSDDVSFEEIIDEIAILAAIRRGEQAIAAGEVVSQEEVERSCEAWPIQ